MQISGAAAREAAVPPPDSSAASGSRLSEPIGRTILIVAAALLIEVLFEGWLVTKFGHRLGVDAAGGVILDPADWPKTIKIGLYGILAGLTVVKIIVDRSWRIFTTKADVALVVTGLVMAAAGFAGGSTTELIGQALFVYFRGVIVFYAFRAVRPTLVQVKPLFWIGGTIIAISAVIGFVQFALGRPAYKALGWVNMQWVGENRAHGLLDHPNDLGHLAGLMVLGLLAWFTYRDKVGRRWWWLFGLMALGLSVAQSRQSTVATIVAIGVIAFLRRERLKRVIVGWVVVVALSALPFVFSPANRAQLAYRLGGLFNALHMSGDEDSNKECKDNPECSGTDGEIRVLFAKQGVRLWMARPLLGYGVGQFGGIVAVKADPQWNMDPRFKEVLGEQGFLLFNFKSTSVDVFWLHLLVEVGALGALAYLVWLGLVAAPLLRATWPMARRRGPPKEGGPILVWSVATLVFAVLIAAWSPALEDPLFPPLMFGILGLGWVVAQRAESKVEERG